eukprot:CAMPEP_0181327188 /NCGR_PEP_ID=MMETSP1101-20121128/21949_1 /TAXON_ID=46948 /ORGANISM="Rhodomonas abbreviata, Strain Caron Lab Isolate" /LENGTH=107 /DNA_ID=CAMNT_0023435793 /DNA_START=96 /DNA_END=419 /DNA_ORIENTATION=-
MSMAENYQQKGKWRDASNWLDNNVFDKGGDGWVRSTVHAVEHAGGAIIDKCKEDDASYKSNMDNVNRHIAKTDPHPLTTDNMRKVKDTFNHGIRDFENSMESQTIPK